MEPVKEPLLHNIGHPSETTPRMPLSIAYKISNVAFYVLNVVVTYLSMTGIFGPTNSDLSQKYQTLVTPAGWAFSIWGAIFILEGIFVVVQVRSIPLHFFYLR